jgi:hypothetical protein
MVCRNQKFFAFNNLRGNAGRETGRIAPCRDTMLFVFNNLRGNAASASNFFEAFGFLIYWFYPAIVDSQIFGFWNTFYNASLIFRSRAITMRSRCDDGDC